MKILIAQDNVKFEVNIILNLLNPKTLTEAKLKNSILKDIVSVYNLNDLSKKKSRLNLNDP